MGLPEQARGTTGQATITGVAGPIVVPQHPPSVQADPVPPDVVGQAVEVSAPAPEPVVALAGADSKSKAPLELHQYDGTGSLETYLAKYESIANYQNWKETDRFHHLCAALDGAAGQVLWGLKADATSKTVIGLLQTRFGNDMQKVRFRAELRARKRKPDKSLQTLYLDITRMVSLAHPDAVPELSKHVATEAFVAALNNDRLQMRVMEQQPQTIEEALGVAGRLEAYEFTLKTQGPPRDQVKGDGQPKNKRVYTVDAEKSSADQLLDKMTELQQQFAKLKDQKPKKGQNKEQSAAPTPKQSQQSQDPPAAAAVPPAPAPAGYNQGGVTAGYNRGYSRGFRGRFRGRGQGRGQLDPNQCATCGEYGHWASDCDQQPAKAEEEEVQIKTVSDDKVRGIVEASFRDEPIPCVLDTTVNRSVVDQALVRAAAIEPFDGSEVTRDRPAPTAVAGTVSSSGSSSSW